MLNATPLATVPVRSSTPPDALTVPAPAMFAATVPAPLSVAPEPIVRPDASASVPPAIKMVPLVIDSAALIVRVPALTSNVWFTLLIDIAAADVAFAPKFNVEAVAKLIANVWPAAAVFERVNVRLLAV